MALCSICERFDLYTLLLSNRDTRPADTSSIPGYFWRDSEQQIYFLHSRSISDIEQFADEGCEICQLLTASFKKKDRIALHDAKDLPVALTRGTSTPEDADDETLPRPLQLEPCIRVFLIDTAAKEMIPLCALSLSIDKGMSKQDLPYRSCTPDLDYHA